MQRRARTAHPGSGKVIRAFYNEKGKIKCLRGWTFWSSTEGSCWSNLYSKKELVEINNALCALYSKLSEYLTHERLDILPINERKVEAEHALFKSITTDVETVLGSELVETELEEEPVANE